MERTSAAITVISAALAGVFIYYSRPISQKFVHWIGRSANAQLVVLGHIESSTGPVDLIRLGDTNESPQPVYNREPLFHLDQLIVNPNGEVVVDFTSGYSLKLTSNTSAILQSYRPGKKGAPVLLTLTSGNYQLLSHGQQGQLFIALNNQIFVPELRPKPLENQLQLTANRVHLVMAALSTGATHLIKQKNSDANPDTVMVDGHQTLTNNYIARTMNEQASALRHCQLDSLRDNLSSDGSLLFSITISPAGRIAHLGVLQDMVKNRELLDCTRSVIERVRFKHYDGEPMTINYPIDYR